MSYPSDFQKRRLFSPLNTISPSQANVTPAKRTVIDLWPNRDIFGDKTLFYEKENIYSIPDKVYSEEPNVYSLDKDDYRKNWGLKTPTNSKAESNRTVETKVYSILKQNDFQIIQFYSPCISKETYFPLHSSDAVEESQPFTVKLVREAQEFVKAFKLKMLCGNLITLPFFQTEYISQNFLMEVSTLNGLEYFAKEPRKEQEHQNLLIEELLDCISTTNKLLESQIEEEHSLKTKIHRYKSSRYASPSLVPSMNASSASLDKGLEEELFYSIERLQNENRRLRFEIEQLEQEIQEICYLREFENLAADATISEKDEELSHLREIVQRNSINGDTVACYSNSQKQADSKGHFEVADDFKTPKVTRKFSRETEPTPGSLIDTRRRLRACIDYLLEERNETKKFEFVERVTYEDWISQLQNKITEYEANEHSLTSCLEERLHELKVVKAENGQLSETLKEKTQQLFATSLQLDKLGEELNERNCEIESLKVQLCTGNSAQLQVEESLQKVKDEVFYLRDKAQILQERLEETKTQLSEREAEVESLRKEVTRKDEQLASSYSSLSDMRSKLLNVENELEQTSETAKWQASQYQTQINSLTEELRIYESRLEVLKSENIDLLAAIQNEKSDKTTLLCEVNNLVEENRKLSHQLTCLREPDEKEKDLVESRKRISSLENELRKKEFEYSILQNDYAELSMKLEMEKDHPPIIDEETFSVEQRRREDAERESAELKDELRKLTQFIKKYREKTESKMNNLRMIVCQRDATVEELGKILELVRNSDVNGELKEKVIEEIVSFFSQFRLAREDGFVSNC